MSSRLALLCWLLLSLASLLLPLNPRVEDTGLDSVFSFTVYCILVFLTVYPVVQGMSSRLVLLCWLLLSPASLLLLPLNPRMEDTGLDSILSFTVYSCVSYSVSCGAGNV